METPRCQEASGVEPVDRRPVQIGHPVASRAMDWEESFAGIELVWHRANREEELRAFLESGVRWVECDARVDDRGRVVANHEPVRAGERWLELHDWLAVVKSAGRSAKIDLKEGGPTLDAALAATDRLGFRDEDLWFNAAVEIPEGGPGFRKLAEARPGARLSCPIDNLASWLLVAQAPSYELVEMVRSWGMNWLCFGSGIPGLALTVPMLQERGWPINVWDVGNERSFDRAVSVQPASITADLASIQVPTGS
jgi:hypothetical protein